MNTSTEIGFCLDKYGSGYDEDTEITDTIGRKLYDGYRFGFAHHWDNELMVMFMLGSPFWLPHAPKRIGDSFLFIPRFNKHDELVWQRGSGIPPSDVFLKLLNGNIFLYSKTQVEMLWHELEWNTSELQSIALLSHQDAFLVWLISSGFQETPPIFNQKDFLKKLSSSIVAEIPDRKPTVKQILTDVEQGQFQIDTDRIHEQPGSDVVTAYLDTPAQNIIEWSAVSFNESPICQITHQIGLKLVPSLTP